MFFAGLFVMVGALVPTGVIGTLAQAAADAIEGRARARRDAAAVGVGLLSAIVDNIPYVATMSPIVAELVAARRRRGQAGAVVGPGARRGPRRQRDRDRRSANVVVLGIAERATGTGSASGASPSTG